MLFLLRRAREFVALICWRLSFKIKEFFSSQISSDLREVGSSVKLLGIFLLGVKSVGPFVRYSSVTSGLKFLSGGVRVLFTTESK